MPNSKIIEELLFKEECYTVIGLCIRIHNKLGKGFKEVVYKDAMEIEFKKASILYEREKKFSIEYEGVSLSHTFDADFLVFDSIILEVKASSRFHPDNFKQTLNYLKASQVKLGILINFGEGKLNFKRIVCSY
jgi:GxxExxY protein